MTGMSPTIRDVRSVAVRIPLSRPVRFATRLVEAREYVLVWIEADDGIVGTGHTYVGTTGGRIVRDVITELLRPLLIGVDADAIEERWWVLYHELLLLGRRGAILRALSAIDIALWDRRAIAAAIPLYRLLGGSNSDVDAYASGGYYTDGDPLEHIATEMRRNAERGFTSHKIKVGSDFALDVERVRVARETIGARDRLALDANNAWKSVDEAVRFVRAIERYDPWWIEEPLSADDIPGHSAVARELEVAVATGELHATRWDFDAIISAGAADILQPDAGVLGGVSEWLEVAKAAAAAHLPLAPHWNHPLHVHLAAATPHCFVVEYFSLDLDIYNFETLITPETRLVPMSGRLRAPNRPGHGIALDAAAVARYLIA